MEQEEIFFPKWYGGREQYSWVWWYLPQDSTSLKVLAPNTNKLRPHFDLAWSWISILFLCHWRRFGIPPFTLNILLTSLSVQTPGFVEKSMLKQIPCFFFFEEIRFHSSWSSWANSEYIDIVFIRFAMNIGISSLPSVPNLKVSKVQNTHFFCWKYLFNKN